MIAYTVEVYAPTIRRTGRDKRTGQLFWQVTVTDREIMPAEPAERRAWDHEQQRLFAYIKRQVDEVLSTAPAYIQAARRQHLPIASTRNMV